MRVNGSQVRNSSLPTWSVQAAAHVDGAGAARPGLGVEEAQVDALAIEHG
jgi:hypothetical protein